MSSVVPDYMNALVGYRAWNVTPEAYLVSLNQNVHEAWPCLAPKQANCPTAKSELKQKPRFGQHQITSYKTSQSDIVSVLNALARVQRGSFEALLARRVAMRAFEKRRETFLTHAAPEANCSCGIYAAKSNQTHHYESYAASAAVWGEVYLWGKIQEYTDGYRAEFAYPKSLSTSSPYAEKLAARYGVPCVQASPIEGDGWNVLSSGSGVSFRLYNHTFLSSGYAQLAGPSTVVPVGSTTVSDEETDDEQDDSIQAGSMVEEYFTKSSSSLFDRFNAWLRQPL